MRRTGLLWVAALCMLSVGSCSKRERTKPSSEQPGGGTAAVGTGGTAANVKSDGDYVRDIATTQMAEVELSRIALTKATSPAIKLFAQTVIDEAGAAGNTLKGVVSGHPIEWPAQLGDKHRDTLNELAKKQGADFDHDYLKAIVEGHQDLGAKLESRLDLQSVADWKTAAAGRTQSKALPDPNVALRDVQVSPNKSANELTMKINQWAADFYPVAQKQLDTARTLEKATKKHSTN